jgi:UDP:flavonoid glycosyltransferase YjiC (YdhE family)
MCLSFYQRNLTDSTLAISLFVREAVERTRPDLVAVDQVAWAAPVARASGLPVVQITHGPFIPGYGPWAGRAVERPAEIRYPEALPAVRAALAAVGAAPVRHLDELLDGELLLVHGPAELGTSDGVLHVDIPTVLEPTIAEGVQARGRPLVALMLGNTQGILDDAVAGVLDAGADAVVLEGRGVVDAREGVQPLETVDAATVLAQVNAAVHHGGSGSIITCLATGIPSIAIPAHGERDFNAHRLEELGAGLRLAVSDEPLQPLELGPGLATLAHRKSHALRERLSTALAELLDGTYTGAAQTAQSALAGLPGPDGAAEAIERVLD